MNKRGKLFRGVNILFLLVFSIFFLSDAFALESSAIVLVNSLSPDYSDFEEYIQPYIDFFDIPYVIQDISTTPVVGSIADYSLIIIGHSNLDSGDVYLDLTEENIIVNAVLNGTGLVSFDGNLDVGVYEYPTAIFGFTYGADYSTSSPIEIIDADHYITSLHDVGDAYGLGGSISGVNIASTSPSVNTLINIGSYPLVLETEYGEGKAVQFTSYRFLDWDIFGYFGGLDDIFWRSFVWAARKPFVLEGMPHFATIRVDDAYGGDTLIEQLSPTGQKAPCGKTDPWSYVKVFNKYGFKPHAAFFLDDISLSWNDSNPNNYPVQIPSSEKWIAMKGLVDNRSMDVSVHAKFGINGGYKDTFFFYNLPSGSEFDDATLAEHFEQANANFSYYDINISKAVIPHFYYIGLKSLPYLEGWGVEFTGNRIKADFSPAYFAPYNKYEQSNNKVLKLDWDYDNGSYQIFNMIAEPLDITYDWLPPVCNWGGSANIASGISIATRVFKREFDSMAPAYLMIHEEYINSCTDSDLDTIMAGVVEGISSYNPEYVNFDYLSQYSRAKFLSNISSATYDPVTRTITVNFIGEADIPIRFYLFSEKPSGEIKSQQIEIPAYVGSSILAYEFPPAPEFRNQGQNVSVINKGESIKLSVEARGEGLQYCSLATNETGDWEEWGSVGSWLQTSKIDFDGGTKVNVDTSFSPGDVRLQLPSTIDYGSYTQGTTASATSNCRGGGCSAGTYPISAIIDDVDVNNPTNCWVSDYDVAPNWDAYVNVTINFSTPRNINRIIIYNRDSEYFETVFYTFSDDSRYPENGTLNINSPTDFEHSFPQRTVSSVTLNLYGLNLAGNAGICELAIYGPVNDTGDLYGNFTSMIFDTAASSEYNTLSWSSTEPDGSSVKLQVATNNDGSTWNFIGPDGTENTFYESSEAALHSSFNENRYVRYKAFFYTNDSSAIPVLHDVRIDYLAQKYDSPHYHGNATTWMLNEFVWQNPALGDKTIGWKVFCNDANEDENISEVMEFYIQPDTTAPVILSYTPVNNSVVDLKEYPKIEFSEVINLNTVTGSVNGRPFVVEQLAFDETSQILTIDLGDMEYEKIYSIVIDGTLEDTNGNQMGENFEFSFSTRERISKLPTSTIELPEIIQPGISNTITGKAIGYIWEKDSDNPLELRHWDQNGNDIGDRPMLHPTALYFPDGENGYKFYLVYTPYPPAANENPSLMRSNDGETFTAAGVTNPLFKYNYQPIYDSQNLADPEYLKVGDTWMIFYEMEQSNYGHLGVAFSTDGVNYEPYGGTYSPARPTFPFPTDGNPVIHFSNDTWYEVDENPADSYPRLGEPATIFKDNMYHIWYGSYNTNGVRAVYANASDPRGPWIKYGPVLDDGRHPDVVYDPERDLYVMWYLCGQNCLATAPRPEGPWTNHPNNPIFSAEGGWEGGSLYRSTLVQVDGQWYLYYSGNPGGNGMIGLAREVPGVRKAEISTNGGSTWTQLTVGIDGSWTYQWTPTVMGEYSIQVRVTDDWLVGTPNETTALVGEVSLSEMENPILVVVNNLVGNFGRYAGEILRSEGLNEYQIESINLVNESYLSDFDVVILTSVSLNSSQVTMLENYVSAGGKLIVFKPDTQLSSMLGITAVGNSTSEGYIKVDNTTEIGKGITGETIQYHTSADNYNLNGATELARLYSDATTSTSYPAVTLNNYGGGEVVAFTYDFPKSIAYQRQGNPLWKGQERDGITTVRANDMFYSNEVGVPHWINPDKAIIPQADEQDKVLAYAIDYLNRNTKPLPRLWYFPSLNETVLINRDGDTDGSNTYIEALLDGIEKYGGRTTLYLLPYNIITPAQSASYKARGHGVAIHVNAGCGAAKTYEQMNAAYTSQTSSFISYHGFHPRTEINHCGEWVGWVQQAHIEENLGFEMDFNYFPWAPTAGGYMTGSGQPIKFVDEDGTIINVFQQGYQAEDNLIDWGFRTCPTLTDLTIQLIDDAMEKYHTPVTMHIHPVYYQPANCKMQWANDSWQHANDVNIGILSSDMWLDFTEMRYYTQVGNITWDNYQLSFIMDIPSGDYEITIMVPSTFAAGQISGVLKDGISQNYVLRNIDNREYAFITTSASTHNFTVTYAPPEFIAPSWQNQGQSASSVLKGEAVVLYAQGKDETALSQAILSTNETGIWENKITYGSPMDMGETTDWTWSNFTWQNPSIEVGTVVGWRIYYKDSSGNTNVTDVMTFTITTDTNPPIWRNQGQNASNILPGESIMLYAEGKDDIGLSYALLSTNETGTWINWTNEIGNWTQTTKEEFDGGEVVNLTTVSPGSVTFDVSANVYDDFDDGTLEGLTIFINGDNSLLENVDYLGSKRAKITDTETGASKWRVWEKTYASAPSADYIVEMDVSVESMDAYSLADLIILARESSTANAIVLRQNSDDVNFNVYAFDGAYHFLGTVSMDKGTGNFHTYKAYFAYGNKTVYVYRDNSLIGSYTFTTNFIADSYRMTSNYQGTVTYYFDNYRLYTPDQSLSGTFISSSYDTGASPDYQMIFWTSTEPVGTSIKLQIATNNDNSTWNFVGLDGTSSTFYAASGSIINANHNGDRYIKYKAFFARSDSSTTPVLDDVSITFESDNYAEYGSPMDMGNIADTWVLSSFTWQNPSILNGTDVAWRIYYIDKFDNENVTDIMTFRIGEGPQCDTGADTDNDGQISMPELMAYIGRWKAGEIEMPDLMKAIGYWKAGVGC